MAFFLIWQAIAMLVISLGFAAPPTPREMPDLINEKIDFATDIKPILQKNCTNCHSNGKSKGGFSIDHVHSVEAGGDSGPAIVKGKGSASLLVKLLLSNDSDEFMPPKGDRLPLNEVALLRAWIDQGLQWEKGFTFAKFRNAPLAPRKVDLPEGSEPNPIDRLLSPYYKKHNLDPKLSVSDGVYARRAFLDTIGLLPSSAEVTKFSAEKNEEKRVRLVSELLNDNERYAEHWITFWNDCFRNSYTRQYHGGGGKKITDWLRKSLIENKPYDQFVRELINPVNGSDGFIKGIVWRGTVNASQVAEMQAAQNVAQVFLGLNIKCASCHDSFINDWTLKQTYALASIFSDGPMDVHRCNKPTGEKASPAFLYPELGNVDPKASRSERVKQLSGIITSPKNGRLARTAVNRLWAIFLGRGLVEPVDEMDNPSWNQDLLDWLAVDLVNHSYDLKHTINLILTSNAYQRPSVTFDEDAEYIFEGPVVRRMSAEQFLDGIDQVILAANSDAKDRDTGRKRAGMRNLDRLMRTLGRPKRDVVVTRRESTATTAQLIELSNGKPLADLMARGGQEWVKQRKGPESIIGSIFTSALGRLPSKMEIKTAHKIVGDPINAKGVEDLLWMLAMHPEFQLIH
ncbi:MAG: PSD1 and planctomycete cytochrome C domain-containing protein [Verrucomicrobiales bacterium]|nr:PSD1 and planctomycete cytochrome C domain-containing protein [Verrucomicrobiales bacterium]